MYLLVNALPTDKLNTLSNSLNWWKDIQNYHSKQIRNHLQVKTSQDVSKVSKVPSLGYAETVEAVFATGPRPLRRLSRASR